MGGIIEQANPKTASSPSRRGMLTGALACAATCAGLAEAQSPDAGEARKLNQLIADSARAEGTLDPLEAIRHGDAATSGFIDPFSQAYGDARLKAKTAERARLSAIDRDRLGPIEQIAYDVFSYKTDAALTAFSSGLFDIDRLTPLDPSFGLQVSFPDAASGAGAPFMTVRDYENGLVRLRGFGGYMTTVVARLREGVAQGYVQPKIVVLNVLAEVDAMLVLSTEDTPFYKPIRAMPAGIGAADRMRLTAAYREAIEIEVLPGYRLWKTYLSETYLPMARDAPGLWAMKDGDRVYAAALRHHTTTDLGADAIHQLGLSEVARIRGDLETVRQTLGFQGDLHALFQHVRTDPQFYYTRPQDLLDRFKTIEARIWLGIPRLFNRKPKAPFEVRPLPSMGEARGTGYYT